MVVVALWRQNRKELLVLGLTVGEEVVCDAVVVVVAEEEVVATTMFVEVEAARILVGQLQN